MSLSPRNMDSARPSLAGFFFGAPCWAYRRKRRLLRSQIIHRGVVGRWYLRSGRLSARAFASSGSISTQTKLRTRSDCEAPGSNVADRPLCDIRPVAFSGRSRLQRRHAPRAESCKSRRAIPAFHQTRSSLVACRLNRRPDDLRCPVSRSAAEPRGCAAPALP